jgi:uncharacterized protein
VRVSLLDLNFLLALAWSHHVHHKAAHRWFDRNRAHGWATCPFTEAGFVRLSMQPGVVQRVVSFSEVHRVFKANLNVPEHEFWPLDYSLSELLPEIQPCLRGHQQVTDAILLDLVIRRKGRLVTFDGRLPNLLPPDSPHRGAIEVVEPKSA